MSYSEKTSRKHKIQSQNMDTWKRLECTKKCPSGQMLSSHNKCLPQCKKNSAEACVGYWGGPCYKYNPCFEKYFRWPCNESGGDEIPDEIPDESPDEIPDESHNYFDGPS